MRIGNGEEIKWNNTGQSIAGRKQTAREGGGLSVPEGKELAALNAYEAHQRLAFEALYWEKPEEWLKARNLDMVAERDATMDSEVRRRRCQAELWAINRILKRRTEGADG